MEATRVRFGPLLEWIGAALVIVLGVGATTVAVRDFRPVNIVPTTPVMANEAPIAVPPAVLLPGAVAIPMLPLQDGRTLRVGERADQVRAMVGRDQHGPDTVERDGTRERVTRVYDISGTRVAVVFEAPQPGAPPVVIAIYR